MKDPYEEAWKSISKTFTKLTSMLVWIAERTLSAKEYIEFANNFNEKTDEEKFHDLIDKTFQKRKANNQNEIN